MAASPLGLPQILSFGYIWFPSFCCQKAVIISKELSWVLWFRSADYQIWVAQGNARIWRKLIISEDSLGCFHLQLVPEVRRIGKFGLIPHRDHCGFMVLFFFFFLRNLCKFSFLKNKNLIKKKAYGFYMTLGSGENHSKTMFNTQCVCLYNHVTANTALCLLRWTVRLLDKIFSRS